MVRERKKRLASGRRLLAFVVVVGITALFILHVGVNMAILASETRINELKRERESMEAEIKRLEIDCARLHKPSRIQAIAQKKLGLDMPFGAPRRLF